MRPAAVSPTATQVPSRTWAFRMPIRLRHRRVHQPLSASNVEVRPSRTASGRLSAVQLAYPEPDLTDGAVHLRRWAPDDLPCVKQAAEDTRITESTTVPAVYTEEAGRAFLAHQLRRLEDGEGLSLAIADAGTDQALGLLWLAVRPQPDVAGIGYWIAPAARGRGVARRAVQLATRWALHTAGATRVEAWVEPDNNASQRLLKAAGFVREGVLRSFLDFGSRRADAVVFSRLIGDGA